MGEMDVHRVASKIAEIREKKRQLQREKASKIKNFSVRLGDETVELGMYEAEYGAFVKDPTGNIVADIEMEKNPVTKIAVLKDIFVKREYRGLGIAYELTREAIVRLKREGTMLVRVTASEDSSGMLLRLGFVPAFSGQKTGPMVLNLRKFETRLPVVGA